MKIPRPKRRAGITLVEMLVILMVAGLIFALLPAITSGRNHGYRRTVPCANNLSQLWKMEQVYMASRGGRMKRFPAETGGAFWLKLNETTPPLIEDTCLDIFLCPVTGNAPVKGETDYLGPAVDVNTLKDGDWVGADRVGNHGKDGGNALRKSGDVVELTGKEHLQAAGTLRP